MNVRASYDAVCSKRTILNGLLAWSRDAWSGPFRGNWLSRDLVSIVSPWKRTKSTTGKPLSNGSSRGRERQGNESHCDGNLHAHLEAPETRLAACSCTLTLLNSRMHQPFSIFLSLFVCYLSSAVLIPSKSSQKIHDRGQGSPGEEGDDDRPS